MLAYVLFFPVSFFLSTSLSLFIIKVKRKGQANVNLHVFHFLYMCHVRWVLVNIPKQPKVLLGPGVVGSCCRWWGQRAVPNEPPQKQERQMAQKLHIS